MCSGWRKTVTMLEIIEKVHKMIIRNRWLKVSKIVKDTDMSNERTFNFLTVELRIKTFGKMSATDIDNGLKVSENENFV